MKKLFLTSVACNILDKFVESLDGSPSAIKVAFIPTAADVYDDKSFVDDDRNKLIELGFNVIDVNIAGKTKDSLQKDLKNVDVIFVAGGNTFYLLEKVLESGFDIIVKELVVDGKYYIGSSAGSVIVGSTIEHVKLIDDPSKANNLKSYDGLKLIDKIILPHFDNEKLKTTMDQIVSEYADSREKIITIRDDHAILIKDDKLEVI